MKCGWAAIMHLQPNDLDNCAPKGPTSLKALDPKVARRYCTACGTRMHVQHVLPVLSPALLGLTHDLPINIANQAVPHDHLDNHAHEHVRQSPSMQSYEDVLATKMRRNVERTPAVKPT